MVASNADYTAATTPERTVASTSYGTVTSKRVTYQSGKGWLSGGSQVDLPIRHITSVSYATNRHPIWGLLLALMGVSWIVIGAGSILMVIALIPLALGVLLLWGSPKVSVNTSGADRLGSGGLPWHASEAQSFVQALRGELVKRD